MRYRDRSGDIVEAEQFFFDKKPWPKGVVPKLKVQTVAPYTGDPKAVVPTIKKPMAWYIVEEGEYIVTCPSGNQYTVEREIFEKNYERVED